MSDKFTKVAGDHPLELFRDPSEQPRYIMLICDEEPPTTASTDNITVVKSPRKTDNRWALHIHLNDNVTDERLCQIFSLFVKDLIVSTKDVNPKYGADVVLSRYKTWITLFKPHRNPLSKNEVQGLIGELIVLTNVLIPKYGENISIESWMNAKKGKQDFICPDKWYEVKTVQINKPAVTISSLEQLDRDDEGVFIIVKLVETSLMSPNCITLNSLNVSVLNSLKYDLEKDYFQAIMLSSGYIADSEYDKYSFELGEITEYAVTENFPRIRRKDLKNAAVLNLTYELLIDQLLEFRM